MKVRVKGNGNRVIVANIPPHECFWSVPGSDGVQECLWCGARRVAPAKEPSK